MCLYDLICLLSWSAMYEQKDSYICEVKHMYQHILEVMDKAREKPKVSEDNTSVPQYYFDSGVIKNKSQKT